MKNVVVIQNTAIGIDQPLSIFLTGFINEFKQKDEIKLFIIISYNNIKINKNNFIKFYNTYTNLYSIFDNLNFIIKSFRFLLNIHKKNRIDVLHCFYPNSSLIVAILFKYFINKKVKIIYEVRSPWIEMIFLKKHQNLIIEKFFKKPIHLLEMFLVKKVNFFIFISEGLKNYYSEKYKIVFNNNFKIIPTSVNTRIFQIQKSFLKKRLNIKEDEILLGQVGGIDTSRDLLTFLKMFHSALLKNSSLNLLFVGDGNAKLVLKKYVEMNYLKEKVHFMDAIEHKDVPELINGLDYGLCHLPDNFVYRYSVPIKIIEYLACGIKVVASPIYAHFDLKNIFQDRIVIYKSVRDIEDLKGSYKRKIFRNKISNYSFKNNKQKYLLIYGNL